MDDQKEYIYAKGIDAQDFSFVEFDGYCQHIHLNEKDIQLLRDAGHDIHPDINFAYVWQVTKPASHDSDGTPVDIYETGLGLEIEVECDDGERETKDCYNAFGEKLIKAAYDLAVKKIKTATQEKRAAAFKADLKKLLEKYNAIIGIDFGEYCDLHGVHGDMTVDFIDDNKTTVLAKNSFGIEWRDL